jgi:hypothetical protein
MYRLCPPLSLRARLCHLPDGPTRGMLAGMIQFDQLLLAMVAVGAAVRLLVG